MTGRTGTQGPESVAGRPAEPAESVPGYRDLARIGHGGFSVVYRAVQESFERAVALKVLTVGPDEDARRRFLREVRLASRLSGHPHVVTVLDTGTTDSGRPYLAMDLYDGGSMKQRLTRSGPLSPAETALLGAKIAEALAAAHSLGVLHRDVKPNNILVSRFGEPALADFGVSCLLDSSSSASVLDVFSPQHAAPELITRGVPSHASDVYSLGSSLYELLTGQPPFGGQSRDVRSIMWRALSEPAPRPDCPELPGLADAIVCAMAKEPEDRFADAAEFARTLRALVPEGASATLSSPGRLAGTMALDATAGTGGAAGIGAATGTRGTGGITGTGGTAGTPVDAAAAAAAVVQADPADAAAASIAAVDATGEQIGLAGMAGLGSGAAAAGLLRGAYETMVRPERVDADPVPNGRGRGSGSRHGGDAGPESGRAGRARKPLIAAAVLLLLGATGWTLLASQNPSKATRGDAIAHRPSAGASVHATAASHSASARPSPSISATVRHSTTPSSPGTKAAGAPSSAPASSASASSSSGALISLPGSYNRFRNGQSGDCLTNPAGQSACGTSHSQGWEYSESLTGILTAPVAGEFEFVNEQSGDCLTGSGGAVSAQACDGDSSQLWSKVSGSGSAVEFQNAGDSQCLRAAGSGVAEGSCGTGDQADLWTEDGSV